MREKQKTKMMGWKKTAHSLSDIQCPVRTCGRVLSLTADVVDMVCVQYEQF